MSYVPRPRVRDLYLLVDWRVVGTFASTFMLGLAVGIVVVFMLGGCSGGEFQVQEAIHVDDSARDEVEDGRSDGGANEGGRDGESKDTDDSGSEDGASIDSRIDLDALSDALESGWGVDSGVLSDADSCTLIEHTNGAGQTFLSCAPLGSPGVASTYSLALALEARKAWPYPGTDSTFVCGDGSCVQRIRTSGGCAVWKFSGALAGHLMTSSGACYVPDTSSAPTWN